MMLKYFVLAAVPAIALMGSVRGDDDLITQMESGQLSDVAETADVEVATLKMEDLNLEALTEDAEDAEDGEAIEACFRRIRHHYHSCYRYSHYPAYPSFHSSYCVPVYTYRTCYTPTYYYGYWGCY